LPVLLGNEMSRNCMQTGPIINFSDPFMRLHNDELRNFHTSPSIIRMIKSIRIRWAGYVARMGKKLAYRLLVGKPEGNMPLERPRRRRVDNEY
jgi:hypothetical protein